MPVKTYDYYGVQLTSLQGMMLEKYLNNTGIAMNTLSPIERKLLVIKWLSSKQK